MSKEQPTYLEQTRTYYNQKFAHLNTAKSGLNTEEAQRWNVIRNEVNRIAEHKSLEILDLGCGRGWLSDLLRGFGKLTAVDISDESIRTAKERFPAINFQCGDVTDAALPEKLGANRFDLVVSSEVIEHVDRQAAYISNISQLLKPGGTLVLTTPNGKWKKNYFYGERASWGQAYEFWLNEKELRELLGQNFHQVRVRTFNSDWIGQLKSFGRPDALGNRLRIRLLRLTGLLPAYRRWLEKKGYGLYLAVTATRN